MIRNLPDQFPAIHDETYIDNAAQVIGDVRIAKDASIWPGAVLRGDDDNYIEVGEGSNIQDGTICHVTPDHPLIVGKFVTVGHRAILHACTIHDEALIGMGAIILDGAIIEKGAQVGAGALVPAGVRIPAGALAIGLPAKVVRLLTTEEREDMRTNATEYIELWRKHYSPQHDIPNRGETS
ncbi:gamma carbonic anhydrase family protein [Brevibacillus choshinensis]|uniref:gamma carbonic anhydrase family protein n=1 Tax=Brevibacillus choshinensis TaxID=54911 RepID=UPI002E1F765C|nr:gamma carbonic anhydrase family protein [Brevibacillus choshinensis]